MSVSKPNSRLRLAAYMVAAGRSTAEIANTIGMSQGYLSNLKSNPVFRLILSEVEQEIRAKTTDRIADLASRYDDEAEAAFETVKHLHRHGEVEAVRLAAAKDISDRSTVAPKIHKITDINERKTILQLSSDALVNMARVLREAGEVIDVLPPPGPAQIEPDFIIPRTPEAFFSSRTPDFSEDSLDHDENS
jgi:hypothetical protein